MRSAVVGSRANGSSAMAAVTGVVLGIAGIIDRVYAKNIVNIPVAIIVDAIARDFTRIHPHLGGKVLVGIIDAGIDDPNDHVGIALSDIPGRNDIDICARFTAELP